nr:MAG TPA: hypothetical protein [Caudoviricetes sp.]
MGHYYLWRRRHAVAGLGFSAHVPSVQAKNKH